MIPDLIKIFSKAKEELNNSTSIDSIELIRVKYLGKKGIITKQAKILKNLTPEAKLKFGSTFNVIKQELENLLLKKKKEINDLLIQSNIINECLDISLPGRQIERGSIHPLSKVIDIIENFFIKLGFLVLDGLELEDCYHNFDALNIPLNHPARNNQDTFWFNSNTMLRTQTSSFQIRVMKEYKPPMKIITSGKVYRKDYDKDHTPMFHQLEGLIIDKNISFANLKDILYNFLHYIFGKDLNIRFRPSYFPFTEPSAEVDIMQENGNWLELLGCGMIHPNILYNVNINSEIYSGFAFGIGIERLAMLIYGIEDLRMFFENDLRFLKQFK